MTEKTRVEIVTLKAQNFVLFDEVDYTFDGLQVVRGRNEDRKVNKATVQSSNGCGKSLLFSILPQLLYGMAPVASKKASKSALTKNTNITLRVVKDGADYIVNATYSKSEKLTVTKDGELLNSTNDQARTIVADLIGNLSMELFYSCVYLDARRPCYLAYATPTQRFDFFEGFFTLEIYEQLFERTKQDLKEAESAELEHKTALSAIKTLPKFIGTDKLKNLETKLEVLQQAVDDTEYFQAKEAVTMYEFIKTHKLPNTLVKRIAEYDENTEILATANAKATPEDVEKYDVWLKKARDACTVLGFEFNTKIDRNELKRARDYLTRLITDFDGMDAQRWQYICLGSKALEIRLSKLNGKSKCGTCGQPLPEVASKIAEYKQALKETLTYEEALNHCEYITKGKGTLTKEIFDTDPTLFERMVARARKHMENINILYDALHPANITQMQAIKKSKASGVNDANIEQLQTRQRLLSRALEDPSMPYVDAVAVVEKRDARERKRSSAIAVLAADIQRQNHIIEERKRLVKIAQKAEVKAKNAPLLRVLKTAFSNKGISRIHIEHSIKLYETALNSYSGYIFGEPIHFACEMTSRNFQILATRNHITTDISSLSGSEMRQFSLLNALALLSFLPIHRRWNTLILDEIEANMDANSLNLFVNEFLPRMQSVIPNITLITPQDEQTLNIEDAKTYTVVKKENRSTIVEEIPA